MGNAHQAPDRDFVGRPFLVNQPAAVGAEREEAPQHDFAPRFAVLGVENHAGAVLGKDVEDFVAAAHVSESLADKVAGVQCRGPDRVSHARASPAMQIPKNSANPRETSAIG